MTRASFAAVAVLATVVGLAGCRDATAPPSGPPVLAPSCAAPVALSGRFDARAPGYSIVVRNSVPAGDAAAVEIARLRTAHAIVSANVYPYLRIFDAALTPGQVAALRCEPSIAIISYNSWMTID